MADDPLNTPQKWDTPKDARSESGAGKYPNYWSHKTRSGHTMIFDDSKGAEHITMQHRSGSAFQFKPDGSVVFTSHNGQYNVVFGEHRMKISGAHDIVVDGAASLRVAKDYNMTINGNINMTAKGDFNITAKNMNQTIRGNLDVQAKNETKKIEGSSTTQAQGALSLQAGSGAASLTSKGGSAFLGGSKAVAITAKGGSVAIGSKGATSIRAEGAVNMQSTGGKVSLKGSSVAMDGDTIKMNSGDSGTADDPNTYLAEKVQVPAEESNQAF